MKLEQQRKEALLWSMIQRQDEVTDRLLDLGVELPEVRGDFYITINGVPACVADLSLIGQFSGLGCSHSSLHRSIDARSKFKAAFPGAVVSIVGGCCPTALSFQRVA
ncbi:hypothetical protein L0152_20180 [bacterium]|nr:hypothetical protein [bacterium]